MTPTSKIPGSVCILTRNSGATLRRALESVRDFDDLVIADGGSTDETCPVACEFGARIVPQEPACLDPSGHIRDYSCARNGAVKHAKHDWVLYIDSDESVSAGLVKEIRAIVGRGAGEWAYRVPVRIFLEGTEIRSSSNYPGWQTRLFRRSSGLAFIKPVHERLDITVHDPRVGECRNPWFVHWTREYARHYLRHNMRYIRMQAAHDAHAPLASFLRANLLIAGKVVVKTAVNYVRPGRRPALPLSTEAGRAAAPLIVCVLAIRERLRRLSE
jgi:glycosyltransferase involved in cell wall biosynthesis